MNMKLILLLVVFGLTGHLPMLFAQGHDLENKLRQLDEKLESYNTSEALPGFVVALFSTDSIYFAKGYGYADLEKKQKYDINTVQGIASVSKTLIGLSLMKAVEMKMVRLDDDINSYLPYKVRNPYYVNDPITLRHLASHTSGITDDPNGGKGNIFSKPLSADNWREIWHPIIESYNKNEDMPMDVFLEKIFSEKGEWYTKSSFLPSKPGSQYEYSNFASALLAHIIEIASKTDYKTFTEEHILKPLNLERTGWDRQLDTINHIAYYNDNEKAVPTYEIITYPDGGLYSCTSDLIKFMQAMILGYYGDSELLSYESFREMMGNQTTGIATRTGLMWDLDQECCIGHGGNDFGIGAMVYFDKRDGLGRILLTNIDVQQEHQEDAFYSIFNELFIRVK